MKKRDLERELQALGWYFKKHGGSHDIWTDGRFIIPVPRHKEINALTAQSIIKKAKSISQK